MDQYEREMLIEEISDRIAAKTKEFVEASAEGVVVCVQSATERMTEFLATHHSMDYTTDPKKPARRLDLLNPHHRRDVPLFLFSWTQGTVGARGAVIFLIWAAVRYRQPYRRSQKRTTERSHRCRRSLGQVSL